MISSLTPAQIFIPTTEFHPHTAAIVNMDLESKQFLACITCGRVVMRIQTHTKKKKNTLMASSEYRLMVTLCHACDTADKIRGAFDHEGVILHINKRMVETWYVYLALTKLVGGSIRVNDYGNGTVQLINRSEFIHTANDELTTIKIHPDKPEDAIAVMCPNLVTGFF
jgi:hypothetical protein